MENDAKSITICATTAIAVSSNSSGKLRHGGYSPPVVISPHALTLCDIGRAFNSTRTLMVAPGNNT